MVTVSRTSWSSDAWAARASRIWAAASHRGGVLLPRLTLCHSHTLVGRRRELFLTPELFLVMIKGELAVGDRCRLLLDPVLLFVQLELLLLE